MCYREKCILDLGSGAGTGPLRLLFWDSALLRWRCLWHHPRAVLYTLAHEKKKVDSTLALSTGAASWAWRKEHSLSSTILGLLQPCPLPRERGRRAPPAKRIRFEQSLYYLNVTQSWGYPVCRRCYMREDTTAAHADTNTRGEKKRWK